MHYHYVYLYCLHLLSDVLSVLSVLSVQGSAASEEEGVKEKTSLQRYFEREMNAGKSMLRMLRDDLGFLKLVAEGEERSTNRTRDIQAALLKGKVPSIWLKYPVPPMSGERPTTRHWRSPFPRPKRVGPFIH